MGSAPKPTSPQDQASAANASNMYAAFANSMMGNPAATNNPYGTTTSSVSGYVPYTDPFTGKTTQIPRFTQNTTLSPAQQAIFDQENAGKLAFGRMANAQIANVSGKLSKPIDYSQFNAWQGYEKPPELQTPDEKYRQQIENNMAASATRANAPARAAEDAQAAARGMGAPGSQYGYATTQARGDIDAEAARQRYNVSGEEARAAAEGFNKPTQQGWLNANTRVDQNNAMRQGRVAEAEGEQTNILNRLMAMFGMGQATVPNAPAFQAGQVNPFDMAGAMRSNDQLAMNAYSDKMKGIMGLGGNILGMVNPMKWITG